MVDTIETFAPLNKTPGLSDPFKILFTQVDRRKSRSRDYAEEQTEEMKQKLFKTVIHDNDSLNQAQADGVSIFSYNISCDGSKDYHALAAEVLKYEKARIKAS